MRLFGTSPAGRLRVALVCAASLAVVFVARPLTQRGATAYTLFAPDGRRVSLPFRTAGATDMVALDQLAAVFNLTLVEDTVVGGLTVRSAGQTILLIPGQSFASIGPGRVVSLPGPVQRDRGAWQVPVDFIRLALAPSLGLAAEVRRETHVVLVGDVRLPAVSVRFERVGANARLTLDLRPASPIRVTREGSRLVARVDAVALDLTPVAGLAPEFVAAVRAEGTSVVVDLGPSVTGYRADSPDAGRLSIDLLAAGAVAPAPPTPAPTPAPAPAPRPSDPPVLELPVPGGVRTVVLDPGHGGTDTGVTGSDGTLEKQYVLQLARRVKAAIESRIGLRVLLTRDGDDLVPVDRRTSIANNNKADLFISLHANASVRPETSGAQVLSLNAADYAGRPEAATTPELPVPVVSGGTRTVEIVPWDFAQIPHAEASARVAAALARHLAERRVPLGGRPTARLPLRPLVGANMPAVLVEVGFLTSATDESALNGADRSNAIVEAIVDAVSEIRRAGTPATGAAR